MEESPSLSALRALASSYCPQKSVGSYCADAITFCMSPLSAMDEYSHELAGSFLFTEEMKIVRQLQTKCKEGHTLINVIYCYRSCARAFPPAVTADETDSKRTKQYYHAILSVLQPQVEKMKRVSEYCSQAVLLLSDNIQRTTMHENVTQVIPDIMMDALLDMMDVIVQLSQLHDTKSSLRNDFTVFKRVISNVTNDLSDVSAVDKDILRLQDFVGSSYPAKNSIWDSLRHNLTNIKRYEQVVYLLQRHCVSHIENDECMTPSSKFKYIRLLFYLMAILEESDAWKKSLPGVDKRVIEAADKLVSRFPVVPMLYEISIKPMKVLQSQDGIKLESDDSVTSLKNRDVMFDVVSASRDCRATCESYLPRLVHALNMEADPLCTGDKCEVVCEVLKEGISLLSKWKCSFLLFLAWKYQNPKSNDMLGKTDGHMESPFLEYERVTKHNYADDEWQAMAEIIYHVKSVVQILRENRPQLTRCVHRDVYQKVQVFVQHTLLPILHRADKRKLACTKLLHDIRIMCGDWMDSELLSSDYKKKRKERKLPQIPDRRASVTLCQIRMLRTTIDSIVAKRSLGCLNTKSSTSSVRFSSKKDFDSSDAKTLLDFYRKAGAFPVLLDLNATLTELNDFSDLWFRELCVEWVKSAQIPAEISLPWLLIERCLDSTSSFKEPVLAILDAYNDAGNRSLYQLQQQHLYDEIEAEGKLCFDHFAFTLAERVYLHYKTLAAQITRRHHLQCGSLKCKTYCLQDCSVSTLTSALVMEEDAENDDGKYRSFLTQRHISLFGRSYNLAFQLSQRVNALLLKDLENWFTKFEASDITSYVAMLGLLNMLQLTHTSLALLRLDEFIDLFEATNDETMGCWLQTKANAGNPTRSRIHEQISQSVVTDLCQYFCLTFDERRFIRMELHEALTTPIGNQFAHEERLRKAKRTRSLNKSIFQGKIDDLAAKKAKYLLLERTIARSHRVFFGEPHVEAICELLSHRELIDVANDCIHFAVAKIEDVLALCVPALGMAIPPFRLPRFMYRTEGCYGYFEGKFSHLLDSDELEAHMFHCFREIGNALVFLYVLTSVLKAKAIPTRPTPPSDSSKSLDERQPNFFQCALERIEHMLKESGIAREWEAQPDSQPEKMPNPSSFYHVWCAIEFLSCSRPRSCATEFSYQKYASLSLRGLFGDGVQFAGCTLVHLLGQRNLYDLWNVSQHIIEVHQCEEVKATCDEVMIQVASKKSRRASDVPSVQSPVGTLDREMEEKTVSFVENALAMRATSEQIFYTLETTWPSKITAPLSFTPPPCSLPENPILSSLSTSHDQGNSVQVDLE